MAAGGGGPSGMPAGFTYLGQFVDHDLTFDKTAVMLGANVTPAQLIQARSPSLDLDSLYGGGPSDPESAQFYEADGLHLKMGKTIAASGISAKDGFDLPRAGVGSNDDEKRKALIPDERNDENLAVAQTHLAFIRFHNRVVDTLPASVPPAQRFAVARRKSHQALPVDAPHRLPAEDLRARRRDRRLQQRTEGVRGRRAADGRPDDADRVLGRRISARTLDGARGIRLEQDLRGRGRNARAALRVLGAQREPRRPVAPSEQLDRRLAAPLRLHRGGSSRPRRAAGAVQPCDAHRHDAHAPLATLPGFPAAEDEPGLPEPGQGEDGEARHRPTDGHVLEEQGRDAVDEAYERPGPGRIERRRPERAHAVAAREAAPGHAALVLHPARGRVQQRQAQGSRGAHRRGDVPPRDGGQPALDRPGHDVSPVPSARTIRHSAWSICCCSRSRGRKGC